MHAILVLTHNLQSRSRRSTMSHPLAALKEAHYRATQIEFVANLEKAAGEGLEEVEMTAIRTVRRASVALGFSNEETEARPSGSEAGERLKALNNLESDTDDASSPRPPVPSGDDGAGEMVVPPAAV